jgi:hypothetical protein
LSVGDQTDLIFLVSGDRLLKKIPNGFYKLNHLIPVYLEEIYPKDSKAPNLAVIKGKTEK